MNKLSKCKNCQWYGKPYWSIINPCDNCPMENVETFTRWVDPTIEEKDKEIERLNNIINELTDLILLKKERAENEKDYSKYYIEGFSKALNTTYSTPDGIMLETIKSTTINVCSDLLNKLKELKGGVNNE